MMRSLYSGISGLKNHQTRMDVIGNNISNVNTIGFKASRVTFKDVFSQTVSAAAAAGGTFGGVNAKQIGLGVSLATIDVLHTNAPMQRTDNSTDLTIEGDGFFVVQNANGVLQYTRVGNLYADEAGNLVTAGGDFVMGVAGKQYVVQVGEMEEVLDASGNPILDANGDPIYRLVKFSQEKILLDGPDGEFLDPADTSLYDTTTGELLPQYKIVYGPNYTMDFNLKAGVSGSNPPDGNMTNDYYTADMFGTMKSNAMIPLNVAGYVGMTIDETGAIYGLDETTGEKTLLGMIALANFSNASGLEKMGNSQYAESANSGEPVFGIAKTMGIGSIGTGGLEMSNVDLASEFTDMIVTQRGFQANSRIITTSDSLLEELVNLKR